MTQIRNCLSAGAIFLSAIALFYGFTATMLDTKPNPNLFMGAEWGAASRGSSAASTDLLGPSAASTQMIGSSAASTQMLAGSSARSTRGSTHESEASLRATVEYSRYAESHSSSIPTTLAYSTVSEPRIKSIRLRDAARRGIQEARGGGPPSIASTEQPPSDMLAWDELP